MSADGMASTASHDPDKHWTTNAERMMNEWMDIANGYVWMHTLAANRYERWNGVLLTASLAASCVSVVVAAIGSLLAAPATALLIVTAVLSSLQGVIVLVGKTCKWSDKRTLHLSARDGFLAMLTSIEQLPESRRDREDCYTVTRELSQTYLRLIKAIEIPPKIGVEYGVHVVAEQTRLGRIIYVPSILGGFGHRMFPEQHQPLPVAATTSEVVIDAVTGADVPPMPPLGLAADVDVAVPVVPTNNLHVGKQPQPIGPRPRHPPRPILKRTSARRARGVGGVTALSSGGLVYVDPRDLVPSPSPPAMTGSDDGSCSDSYTA
jgi:hypothetical protein